MMYNYLGAILESSDAELLLDNVDRPVTRLLKSDPVAEYADRLGIPNRLERARNYL